MNSFVVNKETKECYLKDPKTLEMALFLCLGIESGCRGSAVRAITWGKMTMKKIKKPDGTEMSSEYIMNFYEQKNNKEVPTPVSDFLVNLWCDWKVY